MANVLKGNNIVAILAPTLGDITTSKIRIVARNLTWASVSSALLSQGGSSGGSREFGIYNNSAGTFVIKAGGSNVFTSDFSTLFPSGINNDTLDVTINTDGSYSIKLNDGAQVAGSGIRGSTRIDKMLLRIGALGSDNVNSSINSDLFQDGDKCGDILIFIDDVLVRNYQMPPDGDAIIEHESGQNGTLVNSNDVNFESVTKDVNAPTIAIANPPFETIEVGENYSELGAIATDPNQGDLTSSVVAVGVVNASVIDRYKVTYYITNALHFTEQVSKIVAVSNIYSAIPSEIDFTTKDFPDVETVLATFQNEYDLAALTAERTYYGDDFAFTINYWLKFFIDAHKMTGELEYLNKAVVLIDFMFTKTDDKLSQVTQYTGGPEEVYWATPFVKHIGWSRLFEGGRRVEFLIDGNICRHIMQFVDYIKTANISQYNTKVESYIDKCIPILDSHDSEWRDYRYGGNTTPIDAGKIRIQGSYYYTNTETQGSLYSPPAPNNHTSVTVTAMYYITKYRTKPEYTSKFMKHIEFVVSMMKLEDYGTQYAWQYQYDSAGAGVVNKEDINHGSYTLEAMLIARREGWITSVEHEKMLNTAIVCTNAIGEASKFVDGTGSDTGSRLMTMAYGYFDAAVEYNINDVKNLLGEALLTRLNTDRVTYSFPFSSIAHVMQVSGLTGSTPTANTAPVVSAGPDQSESSSDTEIVIQLAATATDADPNTILTNLWTKDSGPAVAFSDDSSPSSTVTIPVTDNPSTTVLRFKSTDDDQYVPKSDEDTMTINVAARVYNSDIDLEIEGVPDGEHDIIFLDRITKEKIVYKPVIFANNTANTSIPVQAGVEADYFLENETNVAGDKGVTV